MTFLLFHKERLFTHLVVGVMTAAAFTFASCWKIMSESDDDSSLIADSDSVTDLEVPGPFSASVSLSPNIGTVVILEWSLKEVPIESATVEYGLDDQYGMVAPVDLNEPNFRTLLLGMKASTEYHFRIVAFDGNKNVVSPDLVVSTGPVTNLLPRNNVITHSERGLEGGFILSCFYVDSQVFIMDMDGDYVWWAFPNAHRCSSVKMSHDGKHIYVKDVNVNANAGYLLQMNMEGTVEETFHLPQSHHDFAVLPDGTITFIFFDGGDPKCDDIVERSNDGTLTRIFRLSNYIDPPVGERVDGCHSNSIHYHAEDDTYTLSILNTHQYIKFSRRGELIWIFGGRDGNDFNRGTWFRQHGHHVLENGNLLLFNNRSANEDALVLEYEMDVANWQAKEVWRYDGQRQSKILGDVQRLPGGNTLVNYSSDSIFHEVDPGRVLLRQIRFDRAGGLSYSRWRRSLYGPPVKE